MFVFFLLFESGPPSPTRQLSIYAEQLTATRSTKDEFLCVCVFFKNLIASLGVRCSEDWKVLLINSLSIASWNPTMWRPQTASELLRLSRDIAGKPPLLLLVVLSPRFSLPSVSASASALFPYIRVQACMRVL